MDDLVGALIGVVVVIGVVITVVVYALAALWWLLAAGALAFFAFGDGLFGTHLVVHSASPALVWGAWGLLFGACWGLHTMLPIYGLAKWRPALAVAPVLLLCLTAAAELSLPRAPRRPRPAGLALPVLWQGVAHGGGDGVIALRILSTRGDRSFTGQFYWKTAKGASAVQMVKGTIDPRTAAVEMMSTGVVGPTRKWSPDTLRGTLERPAQGPWRMSGEGFAEGRQWGTWQMVVRVASPPAPGGATKPRH